MKFIDISRKISPTAAVYEGDESLSESTICDIGIDSPCRITALNNWTTHFLTHIDAPRHFILDGKTLDDVDLDRFCGPTLVVTVKGAVVGPDDIPLDIRGKNVLFRTSNSQLPETEFHRNYVYVSEIAAERLIELAPNMVGIDYLSVDQYGNEDYPAHRGLLGAEILILEGLSLGSVGDGEYGLLAMPLRIDRADGSPVRAVLQTG